MLEKTVYKIREFNRLYMPVFNLLGNNYLGSEYSPAEARVLYEIYENDGCTAAFISKKMNLDKSYLSRIIKKHEKNNYVVRVVSETDSRAYRLHLTKSGTEMTEDFINKSNAQIEAVIGSLERDSCEKLIDAFDTIENILKTR